MKIFDKKMFKKLRTQLSDGFGGVYAETRELKAMAKFNNEGLQMMQTTLDKVLHEQEAEHLGPWTAERVQKTFGLTIPVEDWPPLQRIASELNYAEQREWHPDDSDIPEHIRNAHPAVMEIARAADALNRLLVREGFPRGVSVNMNVRTGEIFDLSLIILPSREADNG